MKNFLATILFHNDEFVKGTDVPKKRRKDVEVDVGSGCPSKSINDENLKKN